MLKKDTCFFNTNWMSMARQTTGKGWRLSACGESLAGRKEERMCLGIRRLCARPGACSPQPGFHCAPLHRRQGHYAAFLLACDSEAKTRSTELCAKNPRTKKNMIHQASR